MKAMNKWQKIKGHLSTINRHKAKVTSLCLKCGLVKQGLKHDLSKYSPVELKTGFKYYQGYRSPIDAQKEKEGYSFSWLHHKGRNPHHWEYWLDNAPDGIRPVRMPFNYVAEMFCDRVAASMIYLGDKYTDASPLDYYLAHQKSTVIDPNSEREILYLLRELKDKGLETTLADIKERLRRYKKTGSSGI